MNGSAGPDRRADAGFTLLETLVVLVVISLLAGLLYEGLRLGNRAWSGMAARADAIDEISVTQQLLRNLIEQAYPLPAPSAQGFRIDFQGGRDRIEFWTSSPRVWAEDGLLVHAHLRVRMTGERKQLVLSFSNGTVDEMFQDVVLLDDIAGMEAEYLVPQQGRPGLLWQHDLQSPASLPQLVRLKLSFKEQDRRRGFDLVVAPKIHMDTECVLDLLTRRCRGR